MTFQEILPHILNHEYVRRDTWVKNNVIHLDDDNKKISMFKAYKDCFLPISYLNALWPQTEEERNDGYRNKFPCFELHEILAKNWELMDENKLGNCGFLMKNLNEKTKSQLTILAALSKMQKEFDEMPYEEKLEFYKKYPDLITIEKKP